MKRVINLDRWAVLRLPYGLVLSGAEDGENPRVSTPVIDLDVDGMTAVTMSGQRYRLVGEPEPVYALSALGGFRHFEGVDAEVVDLLVAAAEVEGQRRSEIEAARQANPVLRDLIVDDPDE